ncbi:MAG: N-acetylmuramoyl-L-alanine amidase [Verrucomicrobia bacterium]|nr:N-acetylmuramoyl-L-alanine amidase [Verrucomicrobiota bacterium]MBI3869737.1 N-acetylmuramoyl-L-alanine amidase [Verrucomicrobiota bacterium]
MRRFLLQFFFSLAMSGLLSPAAHTASAPQTLQRVSVLGHDYVRASSWAAQTGLRARWIAPDQELELTNGRFTLRLIHDSRRVRWNGVWVWISAPVVMRDHEALLPSLDLGSTFAPLLAAKKTSSPVRVICLDPGHGGDDTGKREGSRFEKQYTLLLAQEVSRLLVKSGYKVVMTRSTDKRVELNDRPLIARRANADLFISLHFNAADVPSAQGIEVYCLTPVGASSTNAGGEGADSPAAPGNRCDERNVQLAYALQETLVQKLGREDRGMRRARFAVLRGATMPSALIEAAFMSHATECRCVYSSVERSRLAQAIVQGIVGYKKCIGAR